MNGSTDQSANPSGRPRRRRVLRWLGLGGVVLAGVAWMVGCTATITPPRGLRDPGAVWLLYDAKHRGLVFPEGDRHVEYAFGEWRWYAMGDDHWSDVFRTVLWPTQGTLGRRYTEAGDEEELRRRLYWMRLVRIPVEKERMEATRRRLAAEFEAAIDGLYHSDRYRFDFVPYAADYSGLTNCNDLVAEWLEEMGCEVGWRPVRLDLEVTDSDPDSDTDTDTDTDTEEGAVRRR